MKFLLLTLITHQPDPVTGAVESPARRLRRAVDSARLAEELGYDGFAIGERHENPFISSAPPVVLSHIAAVTSRIALFTGVTTLSLLDPVRAFEDYSTLDNLSGGRLELIIGKDNGAAQAQLFHVTAKDQWDRNHEGYELFRLLWGSDSVTWSGRFRPALIGSPRQILEKIQRYHDQFGHEVIHLSADSDGLTGKQHRESLELFQSEVAPTLRQRIPSRVLGALRFDASVPEGEETAPSGWTNCSSRSRCPPTTATAVPPRCRVASGSGSRSRAPWPCAPTWWCSTSRCRPSTSRSRRRSSNCSNGCSATSS
ncbi:hypothetical protein GCM10027089_23030 [Nocardia thraciensis]